MSSINFDNAYLLLIMIPVMVLLAIPFFLAVKKDNANVHNIVSAILHFVMGICIVFALAGTTIETTVTETDVYVLADVSYSSEKNLDTIDDYIKELEDNLPRNSRLGIVCFAKDQQLLVPLGKSIKSVKSADADLIDNSETDIEGALDYAGTLFRDGVIKRVVLITDGKQTHVKDSNALKRAVDTLRAEGVLVDAVYVDDNISSDEEEVQMVSAVATQNTYCGKEESVVVTVRSSVETEATISLMKGEIKLADESLILSRGNNEVFFDLDTSEMGSFEYVVDVNAKKDKNQINNSIKFSQNVSDIVNVLLISNSEADTSKIKEYYGTKATVQTFGTDDDIPITVEELCCYDEIVLSNVDLTQFGNYVLFLESLDKVVSLYGKSLVTFGNVNTQDNDDLIALAGMLPVKFGNIKDGDGYRKLYTIVIDASLSMGNNSKLLIAKTAAKQVVNNLSDGDYVCVYSFNGSFHIVYSIGEIDESAKEQTREHICNAIDSIEMQHGTLIGVGLEEAYKQIKSETHNEKQIMFISDGININSGSSSGASDEERLSETLEKLAKDNIPVSVIDVGRQSEDELSSQKAQALLKNTATITSGNYTYANTLEKLNDVMFGEGILDDIKDIVANENAKISVKNSTDDVLKGVGLVSGDYVTGFVYNSAKPGATTVLELIPEGRPSSIPLYSYVSYGEGRVSTFVSSISQTSEWSNSVREPFFANILTTNIPSERACYPFTLSTIEDNGYISITVTPAKVRADTKVKITLSTPGESENDERVVIESDMTFAKDCYKYSFSTDNVGKYEVLIEYQSLGVETYTANYSYYVPYLVDYDSFVVYDISVLHKMIGSEGTVMDGDDVIRIVNDEDMVASYEVNMTLILLSIAVAMFVVDIIVRKIKWEDIRSLFGKGRK